MSTTDPLASRDAAKRQPAVTLGEWLDSMHAGDEPAPRREPRRRREAREESWSGARSDDRVLRSALAELDERERRMERRNDDMLDALDRFMDKADRPAERPAARRAPARPEAPAQADRQDQRLVAALDQIERRLDEIASRIDERVQAPAPPSQPTTTGDLDARLADIARRIEDAQSFRRPTAEEGDRLARLETTLDGLVKRLEARPADAPPPLNGPRRRLRPDLDAAAAQIRAHQIHLERGPSSASADDLGERLAALADRLETGQTRAVEALAPAVGGLRSDLAALVARVEEQRPGPDLTPLRDQLETLRGAIAGLAASKGNGDPAKHLTDRLDAVPTRTADAIAPTVGQIRADIAALAARFDAPRVDLIADSGHADPSRLIDALASRIDAAGERIASDLRREVQAAVGDLGRSPQGQSAPQSDDSIVRAMDDLGARIDAAYARIDDGTMMAKIETHLGALQAKLGSNHAINQADMSGLEGMISDLANRMEAARDSQFDATQFDALQSQIQKVAAKLDQSDGSHYLTTIERSIADLFTQIDGLRHDRDQSVEMLALRAADAARPRLDELAQDVSELRSSRDIVDRKTQDTLSAIHDALTKIVQRLGAVEKDVSVAPATPAAVSPPRRPVEPAAPAPDVGAPTQNRAGGRRRDSAPATAVTAAPEKSRFSLKLPFLNRAPAEASPERPVERPASEAIAEPPPAAKAGTPDLPLEPGSGRPTGAPAAPAPDAAGAAAKKANFIAAARRAAQMATDEASAGRTRRAPVFDSRTRPAQPAAAAPSALDKGRSFVEARKKPILIGLAALMMAVIALNVLVPSRVDAPVAPPSEEKRSAAPVVPSIIAAPTDIITAPQAEAPALSEPRAQARPTDPETVGSIPAMPEAPAAEPMPAPASHPALDMPVGMPATTLRAAALRGDPAAAHEIGVRLVDGRGVARDPKLALKWFERAAAEGLAPAQFRVGNMYEKGVGTARDPKLAKSWYQRAAVKGNAKALHNLGVLIAEGGDGKPDYTIAADHFLKAAKLGVRDSQFNIAILLARGLGVTQSLPEAWTWLSIAAAQGDEDAGKKRDEIGARLAPDDLATAKAAAQAFKPAAQDRFANEVATPDKGWDAPVAAAPPPPPARGKGKAEAKS